MNFPTALSEPAASLGAVFEECLDDDEEPGMEGNASSIPAHPFVSGIDWNAAEAHVARLQRQLAQAVEHQNRSAIRHYKHLLRHSHHAKLLAIRLVTQENQGRKTPGVDGRIALTAAQRDTLLQAMDLERRPLPVRRVFIPKKNGKLRPLGIPTIQDRVGQALHKLAMEPEWELQFEPNSYGFRPHRSTWDAIAQCFTLLAHKNGPPWVIEGDIQGFFDHVDHDKLLARLAPEDRGYVRRILQAPTLDPKRGLLANLQGTPQGGILSPLLANIALHGMETALKAISRHQGGLSNPSGVGIHIVCATRTCIFNLEIEASCHGRPSDVRGRRKVATFGYTESNPACAGVSTKTPTPNLHGGAVMRVRDTAEWGSLGRTPRKVD